jgi:hypothetical protein
MARHKAARPSKLPPYLDRITKGPPPELELKTDGLGNALIATAEYYVQDSRTSVGNCILWWAPKGNGYVCDLNEAGIYDGDHVAEMRVTDVPWPVDYVRAHTVTHVRGDVQAFYRDKYKPGPRS